MNPPNKDYGKKEIGPSDQPVKPKPGFSVWIECGVWYTAPKLLKKDFGPHTFNMPHAFDDGVRDCPCGCWILSSSSGGPIDPFGPCPLNPITPKSVSNPLTPCRCGRNGLITRHGLCPACLEHAFCAMRAMLMRVEPILRREAHRQEPSTIGEALLLEPADDVAKLLEDYPE